MKVANSVFCICYKPWNFIQKLRLGCLCLHIKCFLFYCPQQKDLIKKFCTNQMYREYCLILFFPRLTATLYVSFMRLGDSPKLEKLKLKHTWWYVVTGEEKYIAHLALQVKASSFNLILIGLLKYVHHQRYRKELQCDTNVNQNKTHGHLGPYVPQEYPVENGKGGMCSVISHVLVCSFAFTSVYL